MARASVIYLVRIGDGATHKLGVTHMVSARLPLLSGKLRQPLVLVACWRGDLDEEQRLHRALSPADVVVTRVNGTSWTHLCVSPPPRDPRGTPLTTHTTPNRRALRDAAKRARRARKA